MAKEFVQIINRVRNKSTPYEGIFVTPDPDASVLVEWEDTEFHHELEVNPDDTINVLHEDFLTHDMTTFEFKPCNNSVAPGLLTQLCR